jgi:uncharacterized beta-barrel protein YwiB (DUF1934 family)
MLKKVRIKIITDRIEVHGSLFQTPTGQFLPAGGTPVAEAEPEHLELIMEGRYHDDGHRVTISYKESELTGMEGTTTSIIYQKSEPHVISMVRSGTVRTALVFEEHKRHICVYETPIMPFEVSVQTKKVVNGIEKDGNLRLEYTVELRGANAERTRFSMQLMPVYDKPAGAGN